MRRMNRCRRPRAVVGKSFQFSRCCVNDRQLRARWALVNDFGVRQGRLTSIRSPGYHVRTRPEIAESSHRLPIAEWQIADEFSTYTSLCAATRLSIYNACSLPHCAKEEVDVRVTTLRILSLGAPPKYRETVFARSLGQFEAAEQNEVGSRTLRDFVEAKLKYEDTTLRWVEKSFDLMRQSCSC